MEENQSISQNLYASTSIIKKTFDSLKHQVSKRPMINDPLSVSYGTTKNPRKQKNFKSIILHKRPLRNSSSFNFQICDNSSTDNQGDSNSLRTISLKKKPSSSHILKDFEVLHGFFNFQVQFRLLFRASDHSFSVQKFHQLCDFQSNTLVICRTKCNQIIGGYTPLIWNEDYQENGTYFKTDKADQTFLFSVTKNQKYQLAKAKKNKAICCFKNYGPTFGGGYDLHIGDRADLSENSVSYFPRSYTCTNKTATHKYFTGNKNREFKLAEWEVYKVTKAQPKKQPFIEKTQEKQNGFIQTFKQGLLNLLFIKKQ